MNSHGLTLYLSYANDEYELLSDYCNNLSRLSIALTSEDNNTLVHASSNGKAAEIPRRRALVSEITELPCRTGGETSLIAHYDTLNELRAAHSMLVQWVESYSTTEILHDQSGGDFSEDMDYKLASEHLQLSERMLRTCACSSTSAGFGPLFENGMMKNLVGTSAENWHEVRIVALVALRGSIAKMNRRDKQS